MNFVKGEKGVALVIALFVITVLCVMVVEFTYLTRVDITMAANIRDENRALYVAKAGVHAALVVLKNDDNDYDALTDDWNKLAMITQSPLAYSEYLGEGGITVSIIDENRKINVNNIEDEDSTSLLQLNRLFELLEIDTDLIDSIRDWIDSDHDVRDNGAEDDYYLGLEDPYPCKDAPMSTVSELLLVKGITKEIFYGNEDRKGIREYLTIHTDGKINVNTAESMVLQTLGYIEEDEWSFPISEDVAKSIIDYREGENVFEELSDIKEVDGITDIYDMIRGQITVESNAFSVDVTGEVNTIEKMINAVIRRTGEGDSKAVKIALWAVE
ncbi:MAG: type II secretion system minor pseudopilin GspK [Thermodesulfobacteriota bacterium]|nr:type II secretion system minor pseudopilin GspK [Thermodesulfobacteriota bacterium]